MLGKMVCLTNTDANIANLAGQRLTNRKGFEILQNKKEEEK